MVVARQMQKDLDVWLDRYDVYMDDVKGFFFQPSNNTGDDDADNLSSVRIDVYLSPHRTFL